MLLGCTNTLRILRGRMSFSITDIILIWLWICIRRTQQASSRRNPLPLPTLRRILPWMSLVLTSASWKKTDRVQESLTGNRIMPSIGQLLTLHQDRLLKLKLKKNAVWHLIQKYPLQIGTILQLAVASKSAYLDRWLFILTLHGTLQYPIEVTWYQ